MIGQMKHILAAEQKKTDFKPEDENNVLIQYTNVSNKVPAHECYQVQDVPYQTPFGQHVHLLNLLPFSTKHLQTLWWTIFSS